MLVAEIPLVLVVVEAERSAHVLQVVLHDHVAVPHREGIQRIRCLPVRQVRPRAEDAQRAQLAAVLMRHEVIGIVGPCAGVQVVAEDLAR